MSDAQADSSFKPTVDTQWSCQLKEFRAGVDRPGSTTPTELTVGKKFWLVCEGPPLPPAVSSQTTLRREQMRLVLPKQSPYALKILDVAQLGEASAELVATSWQAAEINLENPILTDGERSIGLGKIALQVQSVITQENNPEQKPYAAWTPAAMSWPLMIWLMIGLLVGLLLAGFTLAGRKVFQRRRFLIKLKAQPIVATPFVYFNKELRAIVKRLPSVANETWVDQAREILTELDRAFRWYLAREFKAAVIDVDHGEIAKELARVAPEMARIHERELRLAVQEISKGLLQPDRLTPNDVLQVVELTRTLSDLVERDRQRGGS